MIREAALELLLENPLLLLFLVIAVGYPLGRVKIAGTTLGVASVLFAGIAIGSLHPSLELPEVVYLLGLVIFVYTIGLSSGAGFFASFGWRGLRYNLIVLGMLGFAFALTFSAARWLEIGPGLAGGVFAGGLTNTPALAAQIEYLKVASPPELREALVTQPVLGYSITYPLGVVGVLLAISLAQRLWRVDYQKDAAALDGGGAGRRIESRVIRVTRVEPGTSIHDLVARHKWDVVFGRLHRGTEVSIADEHGALQPDDRVSVVGTPSELDRVEATLGERVAEDLTLDRRVVDYRRMFVSNPRVAGRRIADLALPTRFGAVVTRLRRGDVDMVAHPDAILELGDRVRVLTRRDRLDAVARFFGDSYKAISEIDILTFSLGVALGLVVGLIPLPLPGGITLRLGFAGGPLVVALLLGRVERTGPLVWALPYGANLTLRQIGLILFLAGVGTRAGYEFVTTFTQGNGLLLFAVGGAMTFTVAFVTLWVGHRLLGVSMGVMLGVLAGLQTQPAVLGFAAEQAGHDLPTLGYTTVYPVATVAKIILAQVLVALLL